MAITRIVMSNTAKRGDVIEIKTLVQHEMETGYRRDPMGVPIPRDIIKTLIVTYAGETILDVTMTQGIAANPLFSFSTTAIETGDLVFTWTDEKGRTIAQVARRLVVI